MREKQNPVEKEWAAVVKAEERFLRHAMPARTAGWQEKITRYVPQKLEATLHTAFYKSFELIFDKGTPVIEKTCQKEKKEQNYKINATPQRCATRDMPCGHSGERRVPAGT